MPYPDTGTGSGGSLPFPYTQVVTNGKLQLLKAGVLVAEQDEYGAWFATTVMTGTNSYELGKIISMCAAGENVAFVNIGYNTAYSPVWCATSLDGTISYDPTARILGDTLLSSEAVGAPHPTITGPYVGQITLGSNICFFKADVMPAETYTGKLSWLCELVGTPNKEVASFTTDVVLNAGVPYLLQFKVPLWLKTGQTIKTQLFKQGGANLIVSYGSTDTAQPYRKTYYKLFTDFESFHSGKPSSVARSLETLTAADRIDASAIKNLDAGGYVGTINFAGDLTQFNNASKQNYWKAAIAGTLGGAVFQVGDQLVCKQTVIGTPPNLTDSSYWTINPNTNAIATPTLAGMIKTVDGLAVTADGSTSVKAGYGLKFDGSKTLAVDPPNIDVTTFLKADLLVSGIYKGGLDGSSTLSTLANAVKGNWWNVSAAVTISGTVFAVGDQLWCSATVAGIPANLTSFVRVPSTSAQATTTAFGTVKMGSLTPVANGTASVGSSLAMAREDHAHPVTPDVTITVNGLMLATDKVKLNGFSPLSTTLPLVNATTAVAGTSAVPARVDHVHPVRYDKCGLDFTTSTLPLRTFRDYVWCSAQAGASVVGDNVPWVVGSQADADLLAVYWLQQLTTFFKNLENDKQWDALIGGIPTASSLANRLSSGTFAVAPSSATDMDNNLVLSPAAANYGAEWFELVIASKAGANPEYYTMWFTVGSSSVSTATSVSPDIFQPFSMYFQTTVNQTITAIGTVPMTGISGSPPRTTARTGTWTPAASAFLLCAEPITIECKR